MFSHWDKLPGKMKNDEVKKYYDILKKKKVQFLIKRIFDIFMSIALIILFSPIILVISILIKRDSKGPVVYKQVRVTQNMRNFKVWKFRTMVENADKNGSHVTSKDDNRITKIGNKLRKYRLDEIPQLINILKGDMTFVGTRPEALRYVEHYSDRMLATFLIPAGLTSETSINFKDEAKLLEGKEDVDKVYIEEVLPIKMDMNLKSLENFSLLEDVKTMFMTVIKVIK